jgi:hypothetical protein
LSIAIDAEATAADRGPSQRGDDAISHRSRDVDEREPISDLDRPDGAAADASLVRDRADEIARPHPRLAATTDDQSNPRPIVVAPAGR